MQLTSDKINENKVFELSQLTTFPSISIYLPQNTKTPESHKNPIRFKNALSDVEKDLDELGMRKPDQLELLKPAYDLQDNEEFWQNQSLGLAFFLNQNETHRFRLTLKFKNFSLVSNVFHLKPLIPLIPLINRNDWFYIIALSLENPKLYRATSFHLEEVRLPENAVTFEDLMELMDFEKQVQFHTKTRHQNVPAGRAAVHHGTPESTQEEVRRTHLIRPLKKLESAVTDVIEATHQPLVFVGLDYLYPFYQEVNNYQRLLEDFVPVNPKDLKQEELHQKSYQVAQQVFLEKEKEAQEKFHHLIKTKQSSIMPKRIIPKAYQGYVKTLFIKKDSYIWGTYDQESQQLRTHDKKASADRDLIDAAAIQTLKNSGNVFVTENVPEGEKMAAIFRYTIKSA